MKTLHFLDPKCVLTNGSHYRIEPGVTIGTYVGKAEGSVVRIVAKKVFWFLQMVDISVGYVKFDSATFRRRIFLGSSLSFVKWLGWYIFSTWNYRLAVAPRSWA
jgi:hypothetical protein